MRDVQKRSIEELALHYFEEVKHLRPEEQSIENLAHMAHRVVEDLDRYLKAERDFREV